MSDVRCGIRPLPGGVRARISPPGHPETFSLNLSGRSNQYDLWPQFLERGRVGDSVVVVVDDVAGTHPTIAILTPHFATVTEGPQVALTRAGGLVKYLRVWRLDGWRGTWPRTGLRFRR